MATEVKIGEADALSTILQPYFQSGNLNFLLGSGASLPAIQVAGNIEAQINELLKAGDQDAANLISLDFIEAIEEVCDSLYYSDFMTIDEQATLEYYSEFVSSVDKILFERKSSLLPRQANVFTTNYDTFIEEAATSKPSLILNDGFDRTTAFNGNFKFAPELFFDRTYRSGAVYNRQTEVPTINLFKIHGSTTWKKTKSNILFNSKQPEKLTDAQKADADKVSSALSTRALILPNLRKFNTTLMDRTYYDLLRILSNSMDRENALLIAFGFSFADEHIQDIIKRSLRNPTAQLLIFAYNAQAVASYHSIFQNHRNVKIFAPPGIEVIDFPRFNTILKNIPPVMPVQ